MTDRYENIRRVLAAYDKHAANGQEAAGRILLFCALEEAYDPDTIRALLAERDALAAALEAAREDAERWRFVREQSPATIRLDGNMRGSGLPDGLVPSYYRANTAEELDAAIDQARGKAGGEVEGG